MDSFRYVMTPDLVLLSYFPMMRCFRFGFLPPLKFQDQRRFLRFPLLMYCKVIQLA